MMNQVRLEVTCKLREAESLYRRIRSAARDYSKPYQYHDPPYFQHRSAVLPADDPS